MYNKRIKIEPYPNVKISEDCFENDIKNNIDEKQPSHNTLGDELMIAAQFPDGDKRLLRGNVVKNNIGEKFVSVSPHPIHLYIDRALEDYYKSEEFKNQSFKICADKAKKSMGDIKLLDIDNNNTHFCYSEFIKCKINSIIMITTALEGFCNSLIPNDYVFITTKGKQKDKAWAEKAKFEDEKIDVMIPQFAGEDNYWVTNPGLRGKITTIYKLRNDLIHLKTEENFVNNYSEAIKNVIDVELYDYIIVIIDFFNNLHQKIKGTIFIEFSNEEYIVKVDPNKIDFEFIRTFLKLKNIELDSYFGLSKNKTKSWENKGVPDKYINFFLTTEGNDLNKINLMFQTKYFA